MKKGKEPLRTFGDLKQFFDIQAPPDAEPPKEAAEPPKEAGPTETGTNG